MSTNILRSGTISRTTWMSAAHSPIFPIWSNTGTSIPPPPSTTAVPRATRVTGWTWTTRLSRPRSMRSIPVHATSTPCAGPIRRRRIDSMWTETGPTSPPKPDGGALLVVVHPHLDPTVLQAAAEVAVGSNRQLVADGEGFGNVDAALLQGSADGIGAQPGQQLFRPLHPRVAEADQYDAIISQGAFGEKFLQSVHILPGLVVESGRAFLRSEVDRQPYGAPGQLLIGLGHVRLRADGDGTDGLADKADLVHHGLPGVALGEVDQRPGQGVGFVWADVHEQPAGEGIVFGGDQFRCGQHGLRVTGRYRD